MSFATSLGCGGRRPLCLRLLALVGLRRVGRWQRLWAAAVWLLVLSHISIELTALSVYSLDLQAVAPIVCIMLSGLSCLAKMLNWELQAHYGCVPHLISVLEECGGSARGRRLTLSTLVLWLGTTCSWMLSALLHSELPFFAWFPFDTAQHYAEAFTYQLFTGNLVIVIITGLDCFCLELMIHLSERLQVLNKLFRSFARANARQQPQLRISPSTPASHRGKSSYGIITKKSFMKWVVAPLDVQTKPAKAINSVYSGNYNSFDGTANESLKHCIQYHWQLIELKRQTEKFCGVVLFFQILASMFIICFVTFQATVNTMDAGSLTKCVMYLSVALLQLGLFCNEGTNIVTQSEELMLAMYSSEWPECDAALKQSVIITMMRLQYPLQIRAASYCTLSLETFSKILHTSYTFFTLLRQVSETQ